MLDDDLLAIERRVLAEGAGSWLSSLDEIRSLIASGGVGARERILALVPPEILPELLKGLTDAALAGSRDALQALEDHPSTEAKILAAAKKALPSIATTVNVSTGQRISEADAAAIMFGKGSPKHVAALKIEAKKAGVKPELIREVENLDRKVKVATERARRLAIVAEPDPEPEPPRRRNPAVPLSPEAQARVQRLAAAERARRAALRAPSNITTATAFAPLQGAANSVRATTSSAITDAGNEGVLRMARASGMPVVWVAERNACVDCLAHQGDSVRAGKEFAGRSYDPNRTPPRVTAPPLHPNCRCHLEILFDQSYADALRREADRSVLRGYSLESESMASRLRAAEALLESDVVAPKTVKKVAETAIKNGRFPTRDVPYGA